MLHPKNNRIDYGEQLMPPEGYELAHAVGTTYSLDLEALMMIPVAMFYSQSMEADPAKVSHEMLNSITKAAEKVTIFFQNSHLKVPKKYHPILAYWEKGIVPVNMPKYNASFHPKIWLARFDNPEGDTIFRMITTSRNLTFDRSWDIAFSSTGRVGEKDVEANRPLIDFFKDLEAITQRKLPENFLTLLSKVSFKAPTGFEKMQFWPIGVPSSKSAGKNYSNPITKGQWDDLLIMSPFLDSKTINEHWDITKKRFWLFSTTNSLNQLSSAELEETNPHQFSEEIAMAEYQEIFSETDVEPSMQNLHAKFYSATKNGKSHIFIGSANCTAAAQERNIEFIVELSGNSIYSWTPQQLYKSLTTADHENGVALFKPFSATDEQANKVQSNFEEGIRKLRYQLSQLKIKGELTSLEGANAYSLSIIFDQPQFDLPSDCKVFFRPVAEEQKKPIELISGEDHTINHFGPYLESQLSPFLAFTIMAPDGQSCYFLLSMDIDLPESRLHRIFSSIIDSDEKFLRYLTFLLTGEDNEIIHKNPDENNGKRPLDATKNYHSLNGIPLFEKLMVAASRYPKRLDDVNYLVKKLREEVMPDEQNPLRMEFEKLWEAFKPFTTKFNENEAENK